MTGFDPSSVIITGSWGADDQGVDILVNGVSTGHTVSSAGRSLAPFSLATGFVDGTNTIDFVMHNADIAPYNTGFRVDDISGTGVLLPGTIGDCTDPSLAALTTVGGDLVVTDPGCVQLSLPTLTTVNGGIVISGMALLTIVSAPALTNTAGDIDISNNATLTTFTAGNLETVGGAMTVVGNPTLTTFDAPTLTTIGGDIDISNNASLTTLTVENLQTVGGAVTVVGNPTLTTFDAPTLSTIGGDVDISNNASLTTFTAENLETVGGAMTMVDNPTLTTFDAPTLSTIGGDVTFDNPSLTTLSGHTPSGDMSMTMTPPTLSTDTSMTAEIPSGALVTGVAYTITPIVGTALDAQPGTSGGHTITADPIVGYQFAFDVPTLNLNATISFTIALAGLDPAVSASLFAAVIAGNVSLAVKGDQPGDTYEVYAVCPAGQTQPSATCAVVSLLDAARQPTTDPAQAAFIEVSGLTGHFSSFAVVTVTPATISDTTPPAIAPVVTGPLGSNGWYVGNITIAWNVQDGESAVSSTSGCATSSVTNDTAGTTFTCTATSAGGTASASAILKVDKTPPAATITAPTADVYLLNQVLASSYGCTDGGSGMASCSGPVPSGANVNTSTAGERTFTVNASDQAGNLSSATVTYRVQYQPAGTMCDGAPGHQILPPIRTDGTSVFRKASTVPAKFRVCDASGVPVSTPGLVSYFSLVTMIQGTVTTAIEDEVASNTPDAAFRWDPAEGHWIFNIGNKGLQADATYVFRVGLNDGTFIEFRYGVR